MKEYGSNYFFPQDLYPTSDRSTSTDYQGIGAPELFPIPDFTPEDVLNSDLPADQKRNKVAEGLLRSGVPNEKVNTILTNMEKAGALESGLSVPAPPVNLEYSNDGPEDYFNQFKPGGTAPKPPPPAALPSDSPQTPPAAKATSNNSRQEKLKLYQQQLKNAYQQESWVKDGEVTGSKTQEILAKAKQDGYTFKELMGDQDTELLPKIQPKKLGPKELQTIQQKLMQQKPLTPDEQDALRSHRAAQPKQEEPQSMGKIVTEEVQNLGIGVSNMGKTLKSGFADWVVGTAARGYYGADTLSQLGIDTDLVDDEFLLKMRKWGEEMRPMMADERITAIGYKMFHNQPLTKEEEALIAEYRDDQLTPFVGGGENALLGEFTQTLPSSVPALTQGLVFGIVGSVAGGPMVGGRAGAMVGSQDAAASQNTGSALAELDLLRKGSNLALDPKRAAIQTKLRRLYPMQDDWDKAFAKMEAIVVHEVSDNRLMPLRKTSKETADFVYEGQGYSVNLASIADAASLYTFSAASLPEYLGKNIAWDAGMEGITGFMDYKAVRDAMQTALLEVGMGEITPEEAHLWSNKEAVKSAVMEAAAGATISTGITYGQYALSGSQEMQEQFETNRQMRLGKKIAKGAEARQAQEESLAAYIQMQEEKAKANPDMTLQGRGLLEELYDQPTSPGNLLDEHYNASTGITEKEDTVPSSAVEKRPLIEQYQDAKRDESQDANILGGEAILQDAKEAIPNVQDPAQQTGPTKAQRQEFKKQVAKGRAEIVANPSTLLYAIKLLGRSNKSLKERFDQGKIKVVGTVEEAKAANKGLFVHEMAEAVFDPNTGTTTFIASNISNQSLAERKGFPKKPAIEWPEIGQLGGGTRLSPLERMAIRAIEVMEHEYVGHQGLRDYMSEDQRNSLMERTYSNFHEEIDQYRAQVNPSLNDSDATEEWIVNKYAEKGVLKQTWMAGLQKKLAERKGQTRSVNDLEIRSFFEDVVKQQKKGAPKPAVPETPAAPAALKKEAAPAPKLTQKEEQLKAAQNKPKPAPKPKKETKPPPAAPPVSKPAPKPGRDLDWDAMPDKDEQTIDDSGILGQEEVVAPEPEKPVDPEEIKIPPLKAPEQLDAEIDLEIARGNQQLAFKDRDKNVFEDETDFGGKYKKNLKIVPESYEEADGIGTATYVDPETGVEEVYFSGFGVNDFIGLMRQHDQDGNPTNTFTAKMDRQTTKAGATARIMRSLISRLPEGHRITEDKSVSTDGIKFYASQLEHGYKVAEENGKPLTSRVAINGAAKTRLMGEGVDYKNGFENVTVPKKGFPTVQSVLGGLLKKYGVGLDKNNVYFQNGEIFIDLPVLEQQAMPEGKAPKQAPAPPINPPEPAAAPETKTPTAKKPKRVVAPKVDKPKIPPIPEEAETGLAKSTVVQETKKLYEYVGKIESGEMAHPTSKESDRLRIESSKKRIERYTGLPFEQTPIVLEEWIRQLPKKLQEEIRGTDETLQPAAAPETTPIEPGPIADVPDTTDSPVEPDETDYVAWYNKMRKGQREVLSQKFLSEKGNPTKVSKAIAATAKWEKLDEKQRQRIRELTRGEVPIAARMPKPTTTLQNVDPSPPLGDASEIPAEREPQAPEPDGSYTLVDPQKREMEEIKRQGGDPSTVPVPDPVVEDTELPKAIDSGNDPVASTIQKDNKIVRFAPTDLPILKDRRGEDEIELPKQPDQNKSTVHDGSYRVTGGLEEGKISDAGRLARTLEDVGYENPHEPIKFLGPVLVKAFTEKYAAVLPNVRLHTNPEWAGGHFNGGVGIALDVAKKSNPEQLAFTLLHEIGHATHSLLGDQINKLPNITEELAAIENLLYPNLRQLINDKVAADETSVDGRFFNYLLSPEELIANYNVFIAANPEHMKIAPQISGQLQGEVLNRLDELVVVRNSMPSNLFNTTLAVGGLNEDLSVNMFPPSEAWRKTPQYENAIVDQAIFDKKPERIPRMMELAKQLTTNEAKDNLGFRLYLAAADYEQPYALAAIEKAIELTTDNPRTSDHWKQAKEKRRQEIIDYASSKTKKEKESLKEPESPANPYANDLSKEGVTRAYSNQSHRAEKRAEEDIASYLGTLENYREHLQEENVAEPELSEKVESFRQRLLTAWNALHHAESRVASPMVTGPARFPVKRNEKAIATAERRREELLKLIGRNFKKKKEDTAIRSGTATAAQQLEDKIGKLEDKQKRMKDANRVLRKFAKSGVDGKDHPGFKDYYNAMKAVHPEITEEIANTMISHKDAFGNIGYAPYELTNNNAEIRRAKERLVQEKRRAEEDAQVTEDQKTEDGDLVLRDNGEAQVVVNKELNRVQLKTPEKPAAALIQRLKSRGFRWSPKNQAWQRQDTEDARRILSEIYDDAYPDGDNVADIPTEEIEPATVATVATEPKEEAPAAKPKPKKKQDTGTTHGKIVKVVEDLMRYEEQLVEYEGDTFELFPQVNRSLGWAAAVLRNTDGEDVHRIGGMPGDEGLKHQLGILNRFYKELSRARKRLEHEPAKGPPKGWEDTLPVGQDDRNKGVPKEKLTQKFLAIPADAIEAVNLDELRAAAEGNAVPAEEPLPAVARDAYAYGMTATIPKEIAAIADTESKLAVLPVSDLIISHDMMGVPNPDYTAITKEGQPRNRTNLDNDNKLQDIITNPDVLKLTDNSPQIGKGIPIVGREGVVLSGNNRSRALKYMAEEIKEQRQGFWSDYLARIRVPSLYGFSDVELRQAFEEIEADGGTPVLVRQFNEPLSEKQMREIGVLENQDDTEVMGPGERAKLLGDKLTSSDLAVLTREGEGIYLKNKTVVERLGSRLGTPAELKTYVDPKTRTLTNAGETAVEAAILYKAYGQQVAERYVNDPAPPPSYKALVRVAHEKLQTDAMVDQLSGVNEERSEFLKSLDITDEYLAAYEQYTNNPQIRNLPDLLSDWRNLEEVVAFSEEARPVAILAKAQWGNGREATIKSLVGKLQAWYQSMQGWSEPLNEQVPESKVDALEQIFGDPNYTAMQDSLFSLRRPADVTSWFSGGGTMEAALGDLTQTVGTVEYNAAILEHYNKVHGTDFKPKDIRAVSPLDVMEENPTLYHASPVCCNFSKAKTMRGADAADRQTVEQLVDVITIAQPPIVTIENVPAYAQTELATAITDALTAAGYKHETVVMDSADFGGIQQRKRMLIRGVLEGELPARPEKQPAGDWYAALEDLIDDAPTSEFRSKDGKENWELKRIRQMAERGSIDPTLPIITMGGSAGHSVANARNSGGPAPTLKATSKEVARIIMPDGRVKRVTPRMMARLMGLPDSYKVPDNPELAKTILGNGMEANFTQQLIGPLISKETPKFSLRQKPQQETPKFSLIPDIPRSVNLQARTDKDPASLGGANIVHNENFPSLQEDEAFFESALGSYIKEWRRSKPPTRDQFPNEKKYLKAHQRYRQEEIHEGLTADQVYDRMIQIAKKRGSRQSEMEVQTLFGNKDHFRQMAQQAGSVFDAMVQPQIPQLVISKIQQNLQYPRLHYAAGENHVTGSERVITISHDNMDVFQPFPREPKKSHYGSENEIGFLMVHDREDFKDVPYGETGDRILQLDQIQSDLINEIRKKGVRTKTDEELVELRDAKAAAEAEPDVRQVQYANDLGDLYQEIAAQLPSGQIPALSDLKREADNELLNTTAYYMNSIIKELNGIMFTFGRNKFPDLDNRMEELKRQYKADQEQLMDQAHAASKTYRQESNAEPDHFLRDTYYRRFLEFFVQLAIEEDYNGFVLPTANQVMTANRTDEDKRAGNELYYDRRYPSHIEKYINYLNEKQGTGIELTREDFNNMGEMMLVGRFQSSTRAERNDSRQAIRSFKPSLFSLKNNDPNQKPEDTDENTKNQIMNRHLGLPSMRNAFNKTKLLKQVNRIARGVSGFVDPFAYIAHRDQLLTNRNLAKGEIQKIERIQREIYNAVRELPQERQQELYAYLTEAQEDYFLENESDRALGRRIRDTINDLGQQLVDMGHIPQESYDNYKDRYLPQIYLKYLLPDETLNLLSTGRKPSPMGYTKQRILTGEKSTDLLIQEMLGIIRDPAFLAAQSIGTVGRDLALHRYFEKIADNPKWALEDQFVGFSLHDEFAVSVMEMAEDPNIEFSREAADEMLTRLRIHELEEMPVPSYSRADLKEFDDFIDAISGGYNEKVKLERSEPGASEEDGPGPDETEAAAWRYFRAAFTRFKNELAKSDDKRPYLNVRKLKNSAKHLSNILMSALDDRWGSESLSVKQQAAGENVGLNMDTSDIEGMLSIVEPYLNMRGESVTASYLADELRRIREQIAPNKQAEYQKAIYKLTERMNFYVKDAYEKTGLDLDTENPEPTQGWMRMPKDKRYGALRGMWVKKEIYDDTVGFTQLEPHMDGAQKYLFGDNSIANVYNRYKKLTSVALNPPSMARNFISNKIWMWLVTGMPIFPLLHGNNPMNSSLPYTFRAIRALGLKDSNHPDYQYKELFEKYGLGVGTFSNQELRRIRNEVADFELRLKVHERALSKEEKQQLSEETGIPLEEFKDFSAAKIYSLWFSNLWHRYVVDKGGFVYQQMEFMDKLAVVIYAMEQKGVTEEEAVRLAEDALFDYSLVKPWVRTIRTSPMGSPFFTYTAKILETYPRAVKRDPKGVLRRTLQLLAWQYKGFDWLGRIIQMGLGETIKEMYDDDDDSITDELKKYLGKFAEENMSMSLWPFKDSKDRFQLMDWQYYIPWGQYTKAAELFAQGKFTDAVGGFGLYNTFFFSLVFGYQTGVDPFTGRMFIDTNLPPEHQKVQKNIWALNQVVPAATAGMFEEIPKMISGLDVPTPQSSGVIRNLLDAAAAEGYLGEWFGENSAVDNRGQPRRTLGQSAGRFLFGSNLYSVDPEYHQDKQALTDKYNLGRTKGQLKTQLRAVESNTSLSEEEKREQSYKIEKYFLETLMQQQLEMLRKQEPISEELLRQ